MAKEQEKVKLAELHYLVGECRVSATQVARRLNLKLGFVRRVRIQSMTDPETAFKRKSHRPRFHMFHERARDVIRKLLDSADHPLRLRDF